MKEIPLTKGKFALVDDSDFEWLSKCKWYALKLKWKSKDAYYATGRPNGRKLELMHRVILRSVGGSVDHQDGNGLNNQRQNLRPCNQSQNSANRFTRPDRYKGVRWYQPRKKWRAQIMKDYKQMHIGYFEYSTDAAIAYNEAAKRLFGEFAQLNQIPE